FALSHAVPRRDLIGKLVANRYLVGDVLGAGGLCTVYRGEDLRRQTDVAIKVLPAEKAQVKEFAARFQREVTTAKRIDHPNVAAILDSGEMPGGALFLVMELLKGTLLSNALHDGPLPPARALVIARQMLVGLGRAHQLGVVHRDVKPDNVMLIRVGGLETVKLFDFGIASNDRAAMKLTAPGTAFGTPEYIAPEQAMGQKVDARADLYGVAAVLFEMLCGRLPFVCKDDIAYLRAHIKETPPAPSSVAPQAHLSREVDALVLRALEKDPDKRFESADQMIAAIDRAAGHKPLRIGERRPLLWIALVLLVITAALFVAARYVGTDWIKL
ncbi:MAG: serine/threonine-protein kinase, partial [Polyangia bacterium]